MVVVGVLGLGVFGCSGSFVCQIEYVQFVGEGKQFLYVFFGVFVCGVGVVQCDEFVFVGMYEEEVCFFDVFVVFVVLVMDVVGFVGGGDDQFVVIVVFVVFELCVGFGLVVDDLYQVDFEIVQFIGFELYVIVFFWVVWYEFDCFVV